MQINMRHLPVDGYVRQETKKGERGKQKGLPCKNILRQKYTRERTEI